MIIFYASKVPLSVIQLKMVYHHAPMNPTNGQMSDLINGEEIKLGPHHLQGEIPIFLTTAQARKAMKALAAGKGCTLKMSMAQLKHHATHGTGFFSDLVRKGINFARPYARKGLAAGARYLENKVADLAHLNPPKEGTGFLSDLIGSIGLGVAPPHMARQTGQQKNCMQGEGFLSDALSSIGLGVAPKKNGKKQGKGVFGDILRGAGHAGVSGLVGLTGLGVKPKRGKHAFPAKRAKQGTGFLGNALGWIGHKGIDGLVGLTGLGVNPEQTQQMQLMEALGKKKLGEGLY
jgi:hypothetical protein